MDLKQHLLRQMAFSHSTFGPGKRTAGVVDHIRKELDEVINSNGSPEEWADVVILALDGLTRTIAFMNAPSDPKIAIASRTDPERVASEVVGYITRKQTKNESRLWQDWRLVDPNKAIEHNREND